MEVVKKPIYQKCDFIKFRWQFSWNKLRKVVRAPTTDPHAWPDFISKTNDKKEKQKQKKKNKACIQVVANGRISCLLWAR